MDDDSICEGKIVMIHSLEKAAHYNNKVARVKANATAEPTNPKMNKWLIELVESKKNLNVKEVNLTNLPYTNHDQIKKWIGKLSTSYEIEGLGTLKVQGCSEGDIAIINFQILEIKNTKGRKL